MKTVVFTFGRMNPPTSGHQLLVNKLVSYAKTHSATPRVYLSHSVGKKDPLPYDAKISFARSAFGSIVRKSPARNVLQILKDLEKEGYKKAIMFAGSDRVPEFKALLNKYNGKEYNFDEIQVISAGERDPDADDVSGMSASKMRALVKDDQLAAFMRGAPSTLTAPQRKNMFNTVRKYMLGEDVMEYGRNELFVNFIIEENEDEIDVSIPSDSEVMKHLEGMDIKDLDLHDEDALMLELIMGEEEAKDLEEAKVLSLQQRQKLATRMKGMAKRLARLRQIKAKQMPAQQRLRMRARKAALMILRRRATGKRNLDYAALSKSQRIAVDNALVNRFGGSLNKAVDRISKRILPMIRKKAQTSVAQARDTKESFVYEAKEKEGSAKDVAQDKIQAAKRGMSVADWEKTKADAAHDSPLNIDATKLNSLGIDPTQNDRVAPNPKQGHLHLNRKLSHYSRSVDEGRKSSADKDARDAGDTNIIYQMRKTINSRGEHETVFADGHKAQVSVADAKKMLAKFDALRMPADKHDFTVQAGRSLASFKNVMAHGAKPEKKTISLGGRKFNEFYLGVGRSRTVSAYDNDEPPGTRRIAEVAKDEDRPSDPNRSRPLSQKLDLLLRLGLADTDELQKYRRALRSSKKQALQSPEMREKLADLLDKLIDLTTQDPATYSRVRYRVMTKEALSLLNKAEKSGVDVDIIFEVFSRGYEQNENINEAFARVNSFIAGGKAADMDKDLSEKRGLWDNIHAKRERIKAGSGERMRKPGSKGAPTDAALKASQTEDKDPCWSDYKQVGMKMKNGRQVPNCVPKEEASKSDAQQKAAGAALATQQGRYAGGKKGGAVNRMALMKTKDLVKLARKKPVKEESDIDEAKYNWKKAELVHKHDTQYNRSIPKKKYVDRKIEPLKKDDRAAAAPSVADFFARGGKVTVLPPGKKSLSTMIKPKKYMTPNQAAKVGVTEAQRDADVKMIKVTQPDGTVKFRRERATTSVQQEAKTIQTTHPHAIVPKSHSHPTGKVPYGAMTNKELRDALPKKVKAASEGYTGSEPTSSNPNDPTNRFVGTDAIRKNYASMTPGQEQVAGEIGVAAFSPEKPSYGNIGVQRTRTEVDQSKQEVSQKHLSDIRKTLGGMRESYDLNESFAAGFELAPFARDYGMRVQSSFEHHPEVQEMLDAQEDEVNEAIYQGRNVPLNKPMKGDVKKSKVYVRDPSTGNIKKVNFGDKKLSIKKDQPGRKRSYCARSSGQGNLTKKTSANYWSRRAWDC